MQRKKKNIKAREEFYYYSENAMRATMWLSFMMAEMKMFLMIIMIMMML